MKRQVGITLHAPLLTDLLLNGVYQMDVILCHQCDGLSLPPCEDEPQLPVCVGQEGPTEAGQGSSQLRGELGEQVGTDERSLVSGPDPSQTSV